MRVSRYLFRAGWPLSCLLLAAAGCRRPVPAPPARLAPLTFNQDVEPILSENCFQCHGPDPGGRKAGLRLDRAEFAFARHDKSGPAIIPGDPEHSPLIQRIASADPKQIMPPPEAHKTLPPAALGVLRRWIREGAPYEEHWAYIPPRRPALPPLRRTDWAHNPIDVFILSRLEREGLSPAPEADRAALIRRVTYDLTGLPPTPEEVAAFLQDTSPGAYEALVDRLLASPRYGEHRAHYWLDAARFADTHGLYKDNFRSVWPFRDYVIAAYNQNKPFDQFVREQLAGDLLPARNVDQQVASAFIRCGVTTEEGGSILQELRCNNQRERSEAFGAVFLGLTTGCAVCHDHKFDPITQKDFYRLSAFFNNLTELPSDDSRMDWPPNIRVPTPAHRAAYDAVLAERADVQTQIEARRARARELIAAWMASGADAPRAVATDGLIVRLRCDEDKGTALANSAPGALRKSFATTISNPIWGEETWLWPAFHMEVGTHLELPGIGDLEKNQPFSVGMWFMPHRNTNTSDLTATYFGAILAKTAGGRGWELFLDHGKLSFRLIRGWPDNLILVETKAPLLSRGKWSHILATYDGSGRAAGIKLYLDGQLQPVTVRRDGLSGSIRTLAPLEFGRESPDANQLRQSRYQDFRFYTRALSGAEAARLPYEDEVAEILRQPLGQWNEDQLKIVSDYYFAHRDGPTQALAARLPALNERLAQLAKDGTICIVAEESPRLAYADILARGVYSARLERVRPGVPHFLPQLPASLPQNRRTLADWVVSAANPLTARVTVNRMWQEVFGTGLVATSEDFGLMGEHPSHPELLDWLAVDFREGGWNVKRFYKQLVMSATYRQSARVTPALLEKDPGNRLLARGPRYRMDAEMLRDTALAASGLLVDKVGGPSVKPYQPPGVWESGGVTNSDTLNYVQDHGDSLYRRSLYTFWKRLGINPNMEALDAPVRESACTRRNRTDTPLQALVTMNDPQWLEAARHLAERLVLRPGSNEERLDYLGLLLLARPWPAADQALLREELTKFQAAYATQKAAAAELVAAGESRPNPKIAPSALAPWMLVASTALNLDATLNK